MEHILKCKSCEKYTMKEKCDCGKETITTRPPRYALASYAKYRREARKEDLQKKGML